MQAHAQCRRQIPFAFRKPGPLLLGVVLVACSGHATEFRVGVAQKEITPPMGAPLAGYYHARGADGVLDPLFCKALVIEAENRKVAVVSLDLIGVTREVTDRARAAIEKASGFPGDHVLVSATHAHTGPVLKDSGKRGAGMGGDASISEKYTEALPAAISEAVALAVHDLRPARLSWARGNCENLAFNRRYFMRDGSVGWNPGKLNPNIIMPAGGTDPEVGLLYAELPDANGPTKSIATYVNFAMHPDTTGGSNISADWPGALGRTLAAYHGQHHLTLVGNGTCGNLNHVDVSWKWPSSGPDEQQRIATILGASVFQAYKQLRPIPAGPILARNTKVELPLPEVSEADVADARKMVDATPDDRGGNFMKLVKAYRVLDIAQRNGKPHNLEVQAITIGKDLAWVGLPGEIFVELGKSIKKRSPFAETLVVELANENIGYVPDRRSFAEGNYEPESSRCAPGSGEKLADAAVELLSGLYKQASLETTKP